MNIRQLTFGALLAASLFIAMPRAHAGYAQLQPPPGWSAGGGSTYGTLPGRFGAAAANSSSMWSASTVVNVGGRAVTIPAAGSFAANAGRYAARGLALNPLAIGVAGAAWLAQECIGYQGGKFVRTCGPDLDPEPEPSTGAEYTLPYLGFNQWFKTREAACTAFGGHYKNAGNYGYLSGGAAILFGGADSRVCIPQGAGGGNLESFDIVGRPTSCPAGWYSTPAGCVATPPPPKTKELTPEQVEEIMAPKRVPEPLWPEIPNVPIPITEPKINPTPAPDLTPQPLHIPTGDPVKVPNSNSQRWEQPITTITPAPSSDSPWRVNLTPNKVVSNNPYPIRQPWTGPLPGPEPGADPDRSLEPDPDRGDPEVAPTDTELPELPKLYEPKYKNGLEGVWNEQKEKIKSAPLSNLIENLMPKVNDGGSCPTWNVQLEFSSWANYGSKNVAPPCEVWDWGRMIILVSALILARALIFGG